jgi:hypothetical protein
MAENWKDYVVAPMDEENYSEVLNSKPFVFVKFFTTWYVA